MIKAGDTVRYEGLEREVVDATENLIAIEIVMSREDDEGPHGDASQIIWVKPDWVHKVRGGGDERA